MERLAAADLISLESGKKLGGEKKYAEVQEQVSLLGVGCRA